MESLCQVGSQTLAQLLVKLSSSGCPVDCIVYDAFLHWPLDVANKFGIFGAIFFTQSCAVNNILYHVYKGELKLPLSQSQILLPGLPPLVPSDMPSYMCMNWGLTLLSIKCLWVNFQMLKKLTGFYATHFMSWKSK